MAFNEWLKNYDLIIEFSLTIATIVIAALVARQTWIISKKQSSIDLYDKKYKCYNEIMYYLKSNLELCSKVKYIDKIFKNDGCSGIDNLIETIFSDYNEFKTKDENFKKVISESQFLIKKSMYAKILEFENISDKMLLSICDLYYSWNLIDNNGDEEFIKKWNKFLLLIESHQTVMEKTMNLFVKYSTQKLNLPK